MAVVGGGPGGAFVARLLRLAHPGWSVTMYEEHPPLETFGFGVGLSASTQRNLARSDPETFEELVRSSQRGHGVRLHSSSGSVLVPDGDSMAVARSQLLQVLYRQADRAGVTVQTGARVDAFDLDADVVVAADGVGSPTRSSRAADFGAQVSVGRQRYIWCGADFALTDALFAPVATEFGTFTTHSYPYLPDRSTFLVETDEDTWRAAGFEHTSEGLAPGESDESSRAFLEQAFAQHLHGARLLGNHSRWTQFRTVRCARWHSGKVVLLGDAAHTAHYSVGSGTKLAMEDAIVLAQTLGQHDDVQESYAAYQTARQPLVAHLQALADRSQLWWEGYVERLAMPPEQMFLSFLTRAGNVSLSAFRAREPELTDKALSQYSPATPPDTELDDWVLAQPLERLGRSFGSRDAAGSGLWLSRLDGDFDDPRGEQAHAFLAACARRVASDGTAGVELVGGRTRPDVLRRLDVAERVKNETGLLTSVRGPAEFRTDLAAGLVSARTDLVSLV